MTFKFESYRAEHKIIIIKNEYNIIGKLRLNYNHEYTYIYKSALRTTQRY